MFATVTQTWKMGRALPLTFDSLIALELVCCTRCRDAATSMTVDNPTPRTEGEVTHRQATIAESVLAVRKLTHGTTLVTVGPGPKAEF